VIADEVLERLPLDEYDLLASLLKEAVVVRIQNIAEYYNHWTDEKESWNLVDDFPYVTPPWPVMWAEFESGANGFGLGCIAWELSEDDRAVWEKEALSLDKGTRDQLLHAHRSVKWGVVVAVYATGKVPAAFDTYLGCVRFGVGADGHLMEETVLTAIAKPVDEDLSPEQKGEDVSRLVTESIFLLPLEVFLLALTFCHCKNVVAAPQVFPPKLVEKRAKHFRAPITKVYTLDIRNAHKILNAAQEASGGSLRGALRISRSHFQDYQAGPGLSGKLKGLDWWNLAVLRTKEVDVARKDYRVSPAR